MATHPPASAFVTLWVYKQNVAAVNNQVGFVQVLRTDAAAIIAAGNAVDPATTREMLPHIEGTAPLPWPRPPAPPPPVVVAITAFSAENPARAMASEADIAKLTSGDMLLIDQIGGEQIPTLDGQTVEVLSKNVGYFSIELDLSAEDITGVTATGTVQA